MRATFTGLGPRSGLRSVPNTSPTSTPEPSRGGDPIGRAGNHHRGCAQGRYAAPERRLAARGSGGALEAQHWCRRRRSSSTVDLRQKRLYDGPFNMVAFIWVTQQGRPTSLLHVRFVLLQQFALAVSQRSHRGGAIRAATRLGSNQRAAPCSPHQTRGI